MSSSYPLKPINANHDRSDDFGSSRRHRNQGVPSPQIVRQASAIIWIAVAWTVGMLVFELTSDVESSTRTWIVHPSPATSAEAMFERSKLQSSAVPSIRHNF
ncbi:hypothetical protein Poly59_04780 [Rubripirellula reticaptiva]|uniref:Uncharacterized protein n=1 Tax=Rubripirellula reticaptiva TaxID=2528013 RepID=A0A5C6FDA4_9BACT|nr:hypothetical protein Poly59_04780 [Rubripirellula reticaptiva]